MSAQDLEQLTDDENSGAVDTDVVAAVLSEASGAVDSYCRQRYAVPLQSSEQVKGLTLDIAVYLLYSRRDRVRDVVRQRYQDAVQFLKDVGAGKASLDQPAAAAPQLGSGGVVATDQCEKFSDDNLKGFV